MQRWYMAAQTQKDTAAQISLAKAHSAVGALVDKTAQGTA